jgi:signal transduction histidine kinase
MMIAGKMEGVIGVRFTSRRTFRDEELELAQALANQAMPAVQFARLSELSRKTAIVEERNRVAGDIHDTLAQGFTGVIAQLEAVRGAMSRKKMAKASDHLERAGEMAHESLHEATRADCLQEQQHDVLIVNGYRVGNFPASSAAIDLNTCV